jgi:hypothetical protein
VLIDDVGQLLGVCWSIHNGSSRAEPPTGGGQAKLRPHGKGRQRGQPEVALDIGRGRYFPAGAARLHAQPDLRRAERIIVRPDLAHEPLEGPLIQAADGCRIVRFHPLRQQLFS